MTPADVPARLPDSALAAPPPPEQARAVFAGMLDQAVRYAGILCSEAVLRGLLGPREAERVWTRHLLNSAALAACVPEGATVLDVGSGAGLPGIPLWLARPDLTMTLVEPMERRVAFLREVVTELGLTVTVLRARAEDLASGAADVVVVRAVAPLDRLMPLVLPLVRPHGEVLALKGDSAPAEVAKAGPVLKQWPGARIRVETSGSGESRATIVRISRDARAGPVAG